MLTVGHLSTQVLTMSKRSARSLALAGVLAAVSLTAWPSAQAQDDGGLATILQGLQWGASHEEVLAHYRTRYLQDYQADIAGVRDSLEIDRIRRSHDQRYQRVVDSYELLEQPRTGYEVSVLGGEVAGANHESMLTTRTDNAILYYAFHDDQLFKIVVAYNSTYLGGLDFESFIEQVEGRYGSPDSTAVDETQTGIRYLARAIWNDGHTRLRVENRSNVFGTFVMVFTDPAREDRAVASRTTTGNASRGVYVSDQVRMLQQPQTQRRNTDIADQIIGAPTVVELHVPEAAPYEYATPAQARPLAEVEAEAAAAAEAEGRAQPESEDAQAQRRRRERERERARAQEEAQEEEEEEGITIY
jgi:hypothetical protein